ncbi:hypothetical protein Ancab_011197 [Ancistrocladus abbreviatus]
MIVELFKGGEEENEGGCGLIGGEGKGTRGGSGGLVGEVAMVFRSSEKVELSEGFGPATKHANNISICMEKFRTSQSDMSLLEDPHRALASSSIQSPLEGNR